MCATILKTSVRIISPQRLPLRHLGPAGLNHSKHKKTAGVPHGARKASSLDAIYCAILF
jgi:hypothetical protein